MSREFAAILRRLMDNRRLSPRAVSRASARAESTINQLLSGRIPARVDILEAILDTSMNSTFGLWAAARGRLGFGTTQAAMSSLTIQHKTEVHISTQRMAGTMTTRRQTIRRERAREWPIFEGRELPSGVDILSIEINRGSREEIELVVAHASAILGLALARSILPDQHKLWLIAWGEAVDPTNKVASYHAARDRLWTAIERTGITVPKGLRSEIRIDFDDGSFCFAGSVNFAISELPAALELTRRANTVGLATEVLAPDPIRYAKPSPFTPSDARPPMFVRAASGELGNWIFLARGFGQFDDAAVGVEILANSEFLNIMEPKLVIAESR
jgi:hypothetical protein